MADKRTPLLQSAFKGATELDISFCREVSFVETIDLSGPRLILKFDDSLSILRNVIKVESGDIIKCTLEDLFGKKELSFSADFTVMSMPVEGEVVTLNCLQKEVAIMKIPAVKAQLFPKNRSINSIMTALAPGFTYETDVSALLNSYHLLPGERPSLVLQQLAMEHGAVIYADRGKLCLKKIPALFTGSSGNIIFEYKNPSAQYQVVDYTHINRDKLIQDRLFRRYLGFHITDGFVSSGKYGKYAPEIISSDNKNIMDNMSTIVAPVLDVITFGAGHLRPGISIKFQWNMDAAYNDSFSDESLPTSAVVGNVAHYSAGASNYFCRLKVMEAIKE